MILKTLIYEKIAAFGKKIYFLVKQFFWLKQFSPYHKNPTYFYR